MKSFQRYPSSCHLLRGQVTGIFWPGVILCSTNLGFMLLSHLKHTYMHAKSPNHHEDWGRGNIDSHNNSTFLNQFNSWNHFVIISFTRWWWILLLVRYHPETNMFTNHCSCFILQFSGLKPQVNDLAHRVQEWRPLHTGGVTDKQHENMKYSLAKILHQNYY